MKPNKGLLGAAFTPSQSPSVGNQIMDEQDKLESLKALSIGLLTNALEEIESHRKSSSPQNIEHFLTAEYLLQEAFEYVYPSRMKNRC